MLLNLICDPKLPGGDPIPGFQGYEVNMINLGEEELIIKTYEGHGLRETLFYGLFGCRFMRPKHRLKRLLNTSMVMVQYR